MSEPRSLKTLAIRLPDELHAQLAIVAHLEGLTLTDAIRAAIDGWIDRKREGGDLAVRAAIALEEIEAEVSARRAAIQALLIPTETGTSGTEPGQIRRRLGKSTA